MASQKHKGHETFRANYLFPSAKRPYGISTSTLKKR